jgi:hypothetical protein
MRREGTGGQDRGMEYAGLVRSLALPPGFAAPTELGFEGVRATVLSRADLADDVAGINASLDLITRTRGGGWPTGPVTEEEDFVDLVWHECEFREGYSFSYALYAPGYIGCAYLYPVGRRTPLSADLAACDVDVSWWVTPEAYDRGLYATVHRALRHWVTGAFPFTAPHWSNRELPAGR